MIFKVHKLQIQTTTTRGSTSLMLPITKAATGHNNCVNWSKITQKRFNTLARSKIQGTNEFTEGSASLDAFKESNAAINSLDTYNAEDGADCQISINRLESHYDNVVFYDLAGKLNLKNSEEVPKIERIILSSSVNFKPKETRGMVQESYSIKKSAKKSVSKAGKKSSKLSTSVANKANSAKMKMDVKLDIPTQVQAALNLLTGQKPEERLFRVSRPGLNIREGKLAAFRVTLRKKSVYFFLDRLISDILPNLKGDTSFKGFKSNSYLRSTST